MNNRRLLTEYFKLGIAAASPRLTLPSVMPTTPPSGRTIVLGCGKAAAEMAVVAGECLSGPVRGCVVTRHGHGVPVSPANIEIVEARHPVPDALSLEAGARMLLLAAEAGPDDRVLFLISGGGSSLLCAPAAGIAFEEKQAIGDWLVRSGVGIAKINLVRRHLSRIKGGRLAAVAGERGADLLTYVISDVTGDDSAMVASGPSIGSDFVPDTAIGILAATGWNVTPQLAAAILGNPPPSTSGHPVHLLATNADALTAVCDRATADGWSVVNLGGALTGQAGKIGQDHARIARSYCSHPGRHLLVSGGELTVERARKDGRGGPNLEYLTGMLTKLSRDDPIEAVAGDSDGIDGTEDNAGGYLTAAWADRPAAVQALANNRSYDLFEAFGGLIKTGPTRTNVNDIRMIAVEGPPA